MTILEEIHTLEDFFASVQSVPDPRGGEAKTPPEMTAPRKTFASVHLLPVAVQCCDPNKTLPKS